MKTMNVNDLYQFCKKLVDDGHGESCVVFDTDAQNFAYHLVPIDSADFDPESGSSDVILSNSEPYGTYSEEKLVVESPYKVVSDE